MYFDFYEHQKCFEWFPWELAVVIPDKTCYESRTGSNWNSSNFRRRYTFSGFSIVHIWIFTNRSCSCSLLETSTNLLLRFLSINVFSDHWLNWTYLSLFWSISLFAVIAIVNVLDKNSNWEFISVLTWSKL